MGRQVTFDVLAIAKALGFEDAGSKVKKFADDAKEKISALHVAIAGLAPAAVPLAAGIGAIGVGLAGLGSAGILALTGLISQWKAGTLQATALGQQITTMKGNFQALQVTAATAVGPGLTTGLKSINGLMPMISMSVEGLATQLGDVLGHLLPALATLFVKLNPLFNALGQYAVKVAAAFESWAKGDGSTKLIGYMTANVPKVMSLLKDLAVTVVHLVQGLAPLGGVSLSSLGLLVHVLSIMPVGVLQVVLPLISGLVIGIKAMTVVIKAWEIAQAALNLVMSDNPVVLIALAIVGLVAAIVLAWKNSETFRRIVTGAFTAVKNAVVGAFNWIKGHWPLLLAIITGPIGVATLAVVRNWTKIKDGFAGVANWITGRWNSFIGFFRSLPGKISATASGMWNSVKNALSSAYKWVTDKFGGLVGFVRGLPGKIASAASGMWNGITDAFKGAINAIIGGWNSLHFRVPGVHVGPVHFGGFDLGLPQIPYLAKGGITNGPTLAVVGDNPGGREAIIPLDRAGGLPGSGPVVIELRSSGSAVDNMLLEILRRSIRVRGGNVQVVLGQ